MTKKNTGTDYQELSQELERLLEQLQSEDIDIDEAVKAYERGMELVTALQTYLSDAENKVVKIKARFDKSQE